MLRDQESLYLEDSLAKATSTVYIVVGWLRQTIAEAAEILETIYDELRMFLAAPRTKKGFSERRKELAQALGTLYKAIFDCNRSETRVGYPVCATPLGIFIIAD